MGEETRLSNLTLQQVVEAINDADLTAVKVRVLDFRGTGIYDAGSVE
jgi:hypothetical protein